MSTESFDELAKLFINMEAETEGMESGGDKTAKSKMVVDTAAVAPRVAALSPTAEKSNPKTEDC